jgi:hypothetical protein
VWEAPAAAVLEELTAAIEGVALKYEHVAVAAPSFAGQSASAPLTHVLDETFDPHPNDAGHRIIADAIMEALEAAR